MYDRRILFATTVPAGCKVTVDTNKRTTEGRELTDPTLGGPYEDVYVAVALLHATILILSTVTFSALGRRTGQRNSLASIG